MIRKAEGSVSAQITERQVCLQFKPITPPTDFTEITYVTDFVDMAPEVAINLARQLMHAAYVLGYTEPKGK